MHLLTTKANKLPTFQNASVWIYALCFAGMFMTSTLYNFWPGVSFKLLLRRLDHSAIYLFIAATYTPFIARAQGGASQTLAGIIWGGACVGVILKLFFPGRFERLSVILCLALGWSGLFIYDAVFAGLPLSTILLIVGGGVLYSLGVLFHVWDSLRFQNAIWHAFVVCAAALQFLAVLNSVDLAVP
jgi:hemolysin III